MLRILTCDCLLCVARFARVFQHVWEEEETAGDLSSV